jgi:hypothetical protein
VTVPETVAAPCPEHCGCDPERYSVRCDDPFITAVPLFRRTFVRYLYLINNTISVLERDSFVSRGWSELHELSISECGLRTVEWGAFNGLSKLTHLDLSNNEISELQSGTFEMLSHLTRLYLSYNRLQYLDSDILRALSNLTFIELSNNKLQYLHPNTFFELPNIETVGLANNPTIQIPLNGPFVKSHSIKLLNIQLCNISSLSSETFANLPALKYLDLSYNQLSTVDVTILTALPKLNYMFMSDNPIQCDCRLKELVQKSNERGILTGYREMTLKCDSESEEVEKWVEGNMVLGEGVCKKDATPKYIYQYEFLAKYGVTLWKTTRDKKPHGLVSSS